MATLILTPEKRLQFLQSLRAFPNVTRAAKCVGVTRACVYDLYHKEPDFAKLWDEALAEGVDALEEEAHRRAMEGTDKPIVHQGVVTATYKEYDTTLTIFLLKAHCPERFRERSEVKVEVNELAERIVASRKRAG